MGESTGQGHRHSSIGGMFRSFRESKSILYSLVRKNLEGQYKNSYLGFAWQFITPAVTVLLFYIVMTGIRETAVEDYWLYLCSGQFMFTFLQSSLSGGSACIVNNAGMVQKMAFPREIIVLAQVMSSFIVMCIAYAIILLLMIITGCRFEAAPMLLFIPVMLMAAVFAAGMVFLFSAVTVYVRDVQHFINAFARVLFWVTPMFYLVGETSGLISKLIWWNPFTYYVESFHDILYYVQVPELWHLAVCALLALATFAAGLAVFRRLKGRFADKL
ncbi:MAG: ABC transporter permease [Candidatus Methanomethylophilus sp.]|nr:ABC transporter permease [Methanomethylophilus sp.]MCI2074465.1 ABC transporter permease [Methanomethylophilus sp.]MCI2093864.1 ABC transporter permease [Methanomethylophilus sp.]